MTSEPNEPNPMTEQRTNPTNPVHCRVVRAKDPAMQEPVEIIVRFVCAGLNSGAGHGRGARLVVLALVAAAYGL